MKNDIHKIPFKNLNRETVFLPEGKVIEPRKSSYGICFFQNKLLLVKSAYNGLWELPGGRVENGENYIEAMGREFPEETSYDVPIKQNFLEVGQHEEFFYDDYNDLYFESVMKFYLFHDPGVQHTKGIDLKDVTAFLWFDEQMVAKIDIHPISKSFIKKAIQNCGVDFTLH